MIRNRFSLSKGIWGTLALTLCLSSLGYFAFTAKAAIPRTVSGQPVIASGEQQPSGIPDDTQVVEVKELRIPSLPTARVAQLRPSAELLGKVQSLGYEPSTAPGAVLAQEVTFSSASQKRKWSVTIRIGDVTITIKGGKNNRQASSLANNKAATLIIIDGDRRFETLLVAENGDFNKVVEHPVGEAASNARKGGAFNRWWGCFISKMSGTGCGRVCAASVPACSVTLATKGWVSFFGCIAKRCGSCWTNAASQAAWNCI